MTPRVRASSASVPLVLRLPQLGLTLLALSHTWLSNLHTRSRFDSQGTDCHEASVGSW